MESTIYTSEGGGVEVNFDKDDTSLPIQIVGDEWITKDEALAAAEAVVSTLGGKVPQVEVNANESLNVTMIRVAQAYEKPITFRYAKGKTGRTIEQRSLVPHEVKSFGDHLTVVGFDPDRDEVRAYRVDRIKGNVQVAS
jgi:predicted DNA-binding transcriptional regulator YafY